MIDIRRPARPAQSPRRPALLRLPSWRALGDITAFNFGCWTISFALVELLRRAGLDARQIPLADWGIGLVGELVFRGLVAYALSLLPLGVRLLRVAATAAAKLFLLLMASVAALALGAALQFVPWLAIAGYVLPVIAGAGLVVGAVGAIAFVIRDIDFRSGEIRLSPWTVPVSGWWDTSALDEPDDDPYEAMREGHPYDEIAIMLDGVSRFYGDRSE